MEAVKTKLFAPSDLALPYTAEERKDVQVPREKEELEHELDRAGVPFVTICIGNMTSFALDSPYVNLESGEEVPRADNCVLATWGSMSLTIVCSALVTADRTQFTCGKSQALECSCCYN